MEDQLESEDADGLSKGARKNPLQISVYSIKANLVLNGGILTGLKVPPPVKKRGRPKGSELSYNWYSYKKKKRNRIANLVALVAYTL